MLRAPSQMNTPTLRVIDTPNGEAIVVTRPKKKKHPVVRYLSPLWSGTHWLALVHLIFINLPLVSARRLSYVVFLKLTRRRPDAGSLAYSDRRNFGGNGLAHYLAPRSHGMVPRVDHRSIRLSSRGKSRLPVVLEPEQTADDWH